MKMACKNCENCNKPFMFKAYKVNRARFCSRKCLGFVVSTEVQRKIRERHQNETFEETIYCMEVTYNKYVIKNETGCWGWVGCHRGLGYGSFMFRKKQISAHRYSYMLHTLKPIPKGMIIMHTCDNPECSNPVHLKLGTNLDNNHDMILKGRNSRAKLNPKIVHEIRKELSNGVMSRDIMDKYGLSAMTVHKIKYNRTWKDIE